MAQINLPLSRVLDVSITRNTLFPTERGFGTLLIVTNETGTGAAPVDGTVRVKSYASMPEVAADYGSTQEIYLAAQQAFTISPSPLFIKIGFRDDTNQVSSELDLISAYDDDWYGLCFTKEMRDGYQVATVDQVPLVWAWIESRVKMYNTSTNDVLTEGLADPTLHVAGAISLANLDRTAAEYHHDDSLYLDVAAMSRMLRTNFDAANGTITMKFKKLQGITPLQRTSDIVTKITAFVPGQGLVLNQGNYANTYVTVGGRDMYVEGNVGSGEFKDIIHGMDWLNARISTRVFGVLAGSPKIPYTNQGVQQLVDEVNFALQDAVNNGYLAIGDLDDEGNVLDPYTVTVSRVSTVPAAQRANRIAPVIQWTARAAGAIHYATIKGDLQI